VVTRRDLVLGAFALAAAWPLRARAEDQAPAFDPAADPVFQKALDVNRGLRTFRGKISVHTRLLLGSFTLRGTIYEREGIDKIVFDNVPGIAKSFVDQQPTVGEPPTWLKQYAISLERRDADTTTYRLEPRTAGSVRSIEAVVQNDSGLVTRYVWKNANGTSIASDQTYETIEGFRLVASSRTALRGGVLNADSSSTFEDYALNVDVPDAVFSS
jgi:hypothetical protein